MDQRTPTEKTNPINYGEITTQEIREYATPPHEVDSLWILNQSDIYTQEILKENRTIKES